jgi:pyridoxal phosphate enzyme (YggS family)
MGNRAVDIGANLKEVQGRIEEAARRAGREASQITLVAVTKTMPLEVVQRAYEQGLRCLGENRVGEAAEKIAPFARWIEDHQREPIKWHMVGHLQSRKAKVAVGLFDMIESVDSLKLAREIDKRCGYIDRTMPILLEVNVSEEASKYGFRVQRDEDKEPFFSAIEGITTLPRVEVQGLMTMAPIVADPEEARPYFRHLQELRDELAARFPAINWQHLSMGMTDDYEVAIEEGATLVRIGRAIFGERRV